MKLTGWFRNSPPSFWFFFSNNWKYFNEQKQQNSFQTIIVKYITSTHAIKKSAKQDTSAFKTAFGANKDSSSGFCLYLFWFCCNILLMEARELPLLWLWSTARSKPWIQISLSTNKLNIRKIVFSGTVVRHWDRLPREEVDSLYLEELKKRVDIALSDMS